MDKSDIDKLQRQALGAYLDAIERGSGVGRAKEGLAVVEGIVEAWLRERGLTEKSRREVVKFGDYRPHDSSFQSFLRIPNSLYRGAEW